jgi:maleate isomerase
VFVSCTSVRLAEAAREIETETGVPITSSNHAMAWHALRLAGVSDAMPQWGRLFETGLADA